jgi:EAL domain-containing protein (putative c-di-GMP-specific phosphodiesterase class I)
MLSNPTCHSATTTVWLLTECVEGNVTSHTHLIVAGETVVGRTPPAGIVLEVSSVSKRHALLKVGPDGLRVRDLGSTNGTFVNGTRIDEHLCSEGDLIHFATAMFRVGRREDPNLGATQVASVELYAETLLQFDQLMNGRGLLPVFQPVVRLEQATTVAFELLARSTHSQLLNPAAMFGTAELLGQECQLSELMRREGARIARAGGCPNLFVNTHPKEVVTPELLKSLAELREICGGMQITVEIHEGAVTNRDEMRRVRETLQRHSMLLAYDDFGAGQARMDELSEIPPDYLKFDIKLIRDLDTASPSRQSMIKTLVQMTRDLGICPLAEGIETAGEAAICTEFGFELAQGYFFGKPKPWA